MIQEFHVSGSHYELGLAVGQHFAERIHTAFDNYAFLSELLTYHRTDAGQERYARMLEIHEQTYPDYMQELQGIADGSNRPFDEIFLVNMRGEYRGFIKETADIRGCADCSILTEQLALIGHNEDGSPAFRDHIYFIHAKIEQKSAFTACSYPGFLPGNAFGYNEHGICFSIDNIRPRNIQIGIARHFLARSLLDAISIDDAISKVTPDNRASGFSYTIGSIPERRIVQVEVTPSQAIVKEIQHINFHANHLLEIPDAKQLIAGSSLARVSRAQEIIETQSVRNAEDVLTILGDQNHPEYPIYRRAKAPDTATTICTVLFDLDKEEMRVYSAHPIQQSEQMTLFRM